MSWVRIDDAMPDSLKIAPLSDAAFRAYVTSICYCARSLSDGLVPLKKAREFTGKPRVVQELTNGGLWEPVADGFVVHDYLVYNPPRDTVLAEREKAKARMQRVRSGEQSPNNDRSSPSPSPSPYLPTSPEEKETVGSTEGGNRSSPEQQANDQPPSYPQLKSEWENRIGFLPLPDVEEFRHYASVLPTAWFTAAIDETAKKPRPAWSYARQILSDCEAEQRPPASIRQAHKPAKTDRPKSLRYEEAAL